MNSEPETLFRIGLAAGIGAGLALMVWRLAAGAPVSSALLTGLGAVGVGLLLAAVAAIGVRLQRRDLP